MYKFFRRIGWKELTAFSVACYHKTTVEPDDTVERPTIIELNQVAEQLTHKYLLQQTCTLSVNTSCQMITISLVALADASHKYIDLLNEVMGILESNKWSDDELENLLIECRSQIVDAKTFYLDSVSAMDSALELGQSSSRVSFTLEANTVFHIMSERLYSAEREFQSCIKDVKKVEEEFTVLLADTMKKSIHKEDPVK